MLQPSGRGPLRGLSVARPWDRSTATESAGFGDLPLSSKKMYVALGGAGGKVTHRDHGESGVRSKQTDWGNTSDHFLRHWAVTWSCHYLTLTGYKIWESDNLLKSMETHTNCQNVFSQICNCFNWAAEKQCLQRRMLPCVGQTVSSLCNLLIHSICSHREKAHSVNMPERHKIDQNSSSILAAGRWKIVLYCVSIVPVSDVLLEVKINLSVSCWMSAGVKVKRVHRLHTCTLSYLELHFIWIDTFMSLTGSMLLIVISACLQTNVPFLVFWAYKEVTPINLEHVEYTGIFPSRLQVCSMFKDGSKNINIEIKEEIMSKSLIL